MKIGPIRISVTEGPPYGVWMKKNNGTETNITIPVVVGAVVLLLCCCGWMF